MRECDQRCRNAWRSWKKTTKALSNVNLEQLSITLIENPLSNKTDIIYIYIPSFRTRVLGVKIAEADIITSAPESIQPQAEASAPIFQPEAQSPMSLPEQPWPQQPAPNQNFPMPEQPPAPDHNQPQPGQFAPYGPPQPGQMQPNINQMEFQRPMKQFNQGDRDPNQTCRVNGVEMPGSCEKYNNQNQGPNEQNNRMEQGRPTGQGDSWGDAKRQGPSEEDQKKMEEEQKKMDERRFKDMKKGLSQFASGAKMMKKSVAKIKIANSKCGVGMPEELENALAQTDNLVGKINVAKTAEELDEIVGDIQDVGSVMQDWGPRMGDLSRLCQMLKRADRDAKQFDRNLKRVESQVKANKKVDLSELLAEFKTAVLAQKDVLVQAKELAKTDQDAALEKIEDEFYGNMDNLGNLQMQINAIINISRGLKDIAREINTYASQIKALTRKKIDTADMQALLNNLKSQIEEIKNSVKSKADPEEIISQVEAAFDARQELQDALQEYNMINTTPKVSSGSSFNVKVNLPDAFKKHQSAGEEASELPAPNNSDSGGQR